MRLINLFIISLFLIPTAWAKDPAAKPDQLLARIEAIEASLAENVPFAGAYFVQNPEVGAASDGVTVLHSDGTLSDTQAGMFCNPGPPPNCDRTPPAQGTWEKTGPNEVSVVWIQFRTTDQVSGDFTNNGTILKLTWTQIFDEEQDGVYQHYVVNSFVVKVFSYDQNPITDTPLFEDTISDSPWAGQRINVE